MSTVQGRIRHLYGHAVEHVTVPEDKVKTYLQPLPAPMLLLSLVHATGDDALLDKYEARVGTAPPPFYPGLHGEGTGDPNAAPEDPRVRSELIDLLAAELSKPEHGPYVSFADNPATFQRMSKIATGVSFNPEHLGMNVEQCGFAPENLDVPLTREHPEWLNLVIIGTGMGGLDAAVRAADRGIKYEILEKEAGIGGLWWTQRYPGVAVDTPTTMYSMSWEMSPEWSRSYPLGGEYRQYLNDIADKYGIRDHVSLNSEVTRMEWLEDEQVWELTVLSAEDFTCRTLRAAAVLTAAGNLCRPVYPDVEGIDCFTGESIHTATWRDVDVTGKRVAVVGAGAAAVQVISSLAPRAEHLTVFQRQAHWISPNLLGDGIIPESELWLRRHLPYYMQWSRLAHFAMVNRMTFKMNLYDEDWAKNHPVSINPINEAIRQECLKYLDRCFGDNPELAAKLTPDFPFGAKRPVRDPNSFVRGGYYWALAQPNADVVTSPLARVIPEGLVAADGTVVELDVIIWATGMTLDNLVTVDVVGRDGMLLRDAWADDSPRQGPRAYLGGTVPGFPNLFITDGPNTGVALGGGGHNFMVENMNHYILECLQLLTQQNARSMEVTTEAFEAHQDLVDSEQAKLMWANESKAHTYYRNSAGRAFFASPFEAGEFWRINRCPKAEAFRFAPASGS